MTAEPKEGLNIQNPNPNYMEPKLLAGRSPKIATRMDAVLSPHALRHSGPVDYPNGCNHYGSNGSGSVRLTVDSGLAFS